MPKCDFKCDFNFIEIALHHVCSPVNLLHIFRKPFPKNTTGQLLLKRDPEIPVLVHILRFNHKVIFSKHLLQKFV